MAKIVEQCKSGESPKPVIVHKKINTLKLFIKELSNYELKEVGIYKKSSSIEATFEMKSQLLRRAYNGGAIIEGIVDGPSKRLILATNMEHDFKTLDDVFSSS